MSTVGNRVRKIRKELSLSQDDFGQKIGLSRAGIAAVEADKNKFSQDVLYKIMTTFDINLNYLIGDMGEMFNCSNLDSSTNNDIKEEILQEVHKILKEKGL